MTVPVFFLLLLWLLLLLLFSSGPWLVGRYQCHDSFARSIWYQSTWLLGHPQINISVEGTTKYGG